MSRWKCIVGTGGIGSGVIFLMDGNDALRRGESRLAALSPAKDYCKGHIILHYIAAVLAPETSVVAIGMVGRDAPGLSLQSEMAQAGIDTSFVRALQGRPTLFSACLLYPDKSICNVTSADSASSLVTADYVDECLGRLPEPLEGKDAVIAAPEVPLGARLRLLERGTSGGAFRAASFTAEEAAAFRASGALALCDLLSVNLEEAAALTGCEGGSPETVFPSFASLCETANPRVCAAMTLGAEGCLCREDGRTIRVPALSAEAVATGGAGDAFLAGCVCGLAFGLPFAVGNGFAAVDLGAYFAAESVRDANTITRSVTRERAVEYMNRRMKGV